MFQKKPKKKSLQTTRASSDGPAISSAPSSVANTPQQHHLKGKASDSKETTPTPLSDKWSSLSSEKPQQQSMTPSSCPATPAVGKMVNGGSVPPQHSSTGKNSGHSGINGKGSAGRTTKRRRPSQSSESLQPSSSSSSSSSSSLFTPTTTSTTTTNHISPVAMQPNFATPPPISQASTTHTSSTKRVESDVSTSAPSPVVVSNTPVIQTAAQALFNRSVVDTPRSNGGTNGRVAVATGLNGDVCESSPLIKTEFKGQTDIKVKKEEESFKWEPTANAKKASRDLPTPTVKVESVSADVLGTLLQSQFLCMPQVDMANSLICSERVPGMISGDLKPVIKPVRHIAMRKCPSPRNKATPPSKKNDIDTLSSSNLSETHSPVPRHPVDSPPSSQSASELSPSPPSSPTLPSSLKKLSHSSSSSSLASSLSASGPTTSLLGKNGVARLAESTIQERGVPEEARMDTDESNLPDQDSPSSASLSDNSSEKERSPLPSEQRPRSKCSQSPEGKRRWRIYETEEEFQKRRKARRSDLNFMVDFCKSTLCVCVCVCV